MCGGCVSHCCKTQLITATSSTEAESLAAVTAAKHAKCLRSIVTDLGFPQLHPTKLHCDNQSTIHIINSRTPTKCSRHIDILFFAIQDWKEAKQMTMKCIPGVINPADDLTKPLGWVLDSHHCRHPMGHCAPSTS